MNPIKIGNLISKKRKEKSMTQKELAEKLGLTDRAISKWERGLGCPDISYLEDLSKVLGISVVELLRGEEKYETSSDDVIESIRLSSDITKYNIKNSISIVTTTVIVIIIILLSVFNLTNLYYLNKKNKKDYEFKNNNLNSYYEIIKNNQGIYSESDYNLILNYINNKTKLNFNDINDKYIVKSYYKFFNEYSKLRISDRISGNDIYNILIKYNPSVSNNLINYNSIILYTNEVILNYYDFLRCTYSYYDKCSDKSFIDIITNYEFNNEEMLLQDIIEVGELNA